MNRNTGWNKISKTCLVKPRAKRTIGVVASIVLVLFLCSFFLGGTNKSSSETSSKTWMSGILDSTRICDINIPGTHNSGTQYTEALISGIVASCQSDSISTQLSEGIRYLDLRINEDMEINHNSVLCYTSGWTFLSFGKHKLTLDKVLNDVEGFLKANPTETVIIQIKKEGTKKDDSVFANKINPLLEKRSLRYDASRRSKDLTMGDVRGKFVVFSRTSGVVDSYKYTSWADDCTSADAYLDSASVKLQDNYNEHSGDKKFETIKNFYHDVWASGHNSYIVNFTSCVGPYIPKAVAKTVNEKFQRFVQENSNRRFGIVLMDNPSAELISAVYKTNFMN